MAAAASPSSSVAANANAGNIGSPSVDRQAEAELKAQAATKAMYAQVVNIAMFLGLNMLIKKYNLTDSAYLLYTRISFAIAQAILIGTLLFVRTRIVAKADKGLVEVVTPPPPFSGKPPKRERVTVEAYDQKELGRALQNAVFQLAILLGIHYFFKTSRVLIFQSIMPLRDLFTSPLVRIHLFGRPAVGDLSRPFREPSSPLGDLLKELQQPATTDAKKDVKDSDASESEDEKSTRPLLSDEEPKIKILESSGSESGSSPVKSQSSSGGPRNRSAGKGGKKN